MVWLCSALCTLGTRSAISQVSLRSRGKDPHGVCEGIIHLLGPSFTPKDAAGDAGGVHTATVPQPAAPALAGMEAQGEQTSAQGRPCPS